MALKDLIARPGEKAAAAIMKEWRVSDLDLLARVRDLVDAAVAAEREACAKIAETVTGDFQRDTASRTESLVRKRIASAIRNHS
jgi:hypothetical protein